MSHGKSAASVVIGIDGDAKNFTHLVMVGLDEQRLLRGKRLELGAREIENHIGTTRMGMIHDLVQEVRRGLGRHRAGNNQTVKVTRGIQNVVELLLSLRSKRSARVQNAVLVLAIVEVRIDTGDAIGPHRATEAAHVHGLIDNKTPGKTSKETERDGIDAKFLKGKRYIETLTIGRVASIARTNIFVGHERLTGDRHIDGRVGG